MDIQKEEEDFNAWFNKQTINAVPDADLSLQKLWASLAWQAAKADAAPEESKREGGYYLQDCRGYIGNCMKFWYTHGYGAKLHNFHWFPTLDDALKAAGGAPWHEPWYAPYVDSLAEKTIDMQLADREQEKAMIEAQG